MSYNTDLQSKNDRIQALINKANTLPDAGGGIELPALSNPATSDEILEGYETIDKDGNIIVGVHVCEGSGSSGGTSFDTCTVNVTTYMGIGFLYAYYISIANGIPCLSYQVASGTVSLTMENVLCNSLVSIPLASSIPGYSIDYGAELVEMGGTISATHAMIFKITASAGETVTITCYDDD